MFAGIVGVGAGEVTVCKLWAGTEKGEGTGRSGGECRHSGGFVVHAVGWTARCTILASSSLCCVSSAPLINNSTLSKSPHIPHIPYDFFASQKPAPPDESLPFNFGTAGAK